MIARRIYWVILILSIIIGIYFFGMARDKFDPEFLIFFALVPFFMFASSVYGLIAHLLKPSVKGGMIAYPLIMGILFVLLFFIHVFVIVPLLCPDFLSGFK